MKNLFRSYAALDKESRIKKAQKIVNIISKYKDIKDSSILDIGCGSGYAGHLLDKRSKLYIGLDYVDERKIQSFRFFRGTASSIPFKDGSFDIIICNHVLEHVPDQGKLINEIYRLLKKDGICYITSPNKLWPMEPHLKLPFLSIMPRKIANMYVRIAGRGKIYDVVPLTYSQFRRKLGKKFRFENYTLEILMNPKNYGFNGKLYSIFSVSKFLPRFLLNSINYFLPNWIVILRKRASS